MKGIWMLFILAALLLFGPEGPVMADCRIWIIDAASGAESGMNDRILLILLLLAAAFAAWLADRRRRNREA